MKIVRSAVAVVLNSAVKCAVNRAVLCTLTALETAASCASCACVCVRVCVLATTLLFLLLLAQSNDRRRGESSRDAHVLRQEKKAKKENTSILKTRKQTRCVYALWSNNFAVQVNKMVSP